MTEQELVTSYIEGQIGRRVFIRRLVQSGVSLSAAVAYAGTLGATPAAATHDGSPDIYDEDRLIKVSKAAIDPEVTSVLRGGLVQWDFKNGPHAFEDRMYSVTDPLDFIYLDGNVFWAGHRALRFFSAGTFPYSVDVQSRNVQGGAWGGPVTHDGKIQSLLRVSRARVAKGHKVTVSWASKNAPNKYVYDVQIKRPDEASFSDWKTEVTEPSADFRPGQTGTYRFRARLHRVSDDACSGWSPGRSLRSV